ncbi:MULTISPECIES: indolepyruvate ferredoxin oxidoreductase family protein [unclassified Herbaspirillum]|uniref:indolepyruvate ferredoxin oxidoreductase family protein n=1 Tax=unclassified Herbaspirillum TaxID=2624150 RepID=UPI000E2F08E2|nr:MULTISPECIES: indolepyruvate ferredoxin oxidoreductase family protein [unclassified Herbaspirillum]RFB73000.1 indolepyruvate ferredoxin oxidoreductase family protein [Herbaspirillum sp. 3R-3a1]TFI11189.1 indolepyruvate ferredoxin oxidoreductase family protein [Herbaspirillum sp. 3R11]TFI17098.1 indolepyruvate ferredoxin oxidoreductase family protein [Herbaspirillum sp. 3R-11]TFI26700.1 indolepyruvate ferredoxin oxidoreductase family protein [Herbaspirillum sp. 3C11]
MEYRSAAEPVELSAPDRSGRAVTPAATTVANSASTPVSGTVPLATVSLDDKYTATSGSIFLSGIQALVRLPLLQYLRDQKAGLNTAGFISGYRGSPLGGLDEALWKAQPHLETHKIKFQPGTNEDMAATAVWGTQQVDLIGPAKVEGVFSMWYGKGPGVDRCGDVLKHMNHAGTSAKGGVLLVAGDDHGAYSSTLPHQSDHIFSASMIPMLYPCNVQEYLDLGLHGWAMSRFSGCTVGFKALADTVESSASVDADPFRVEIKYPADFVMPEGGLNARLSTDTLGVQARKQEALMQDYKIYAALAYARANKLNRVMIDSPKARLGIIASGKSYLDVLEALSELGIDEDFAAEIGLRLFKVSMPWPLEPEGVREFAQGLDEILVVEEKRQMVEYQLKEQLYNWRDDVRPRVIGKFDEKGEWVAPRGEWLLTSKADFSVAQIARVIAARIARFHTSDLIKARLAFLDAKDAVLNKAVSTPPRPAYYCSGCPHNTSTKVPEGSFALAGIGCHVMATAIYPEFNKLTTHMGGEGGPWIGQAPFSKVPHVFANLGDGTYFHSGYLAIRAAVAANVNMTYKILYNDAVAMTGGQPVDGTTSVPMIAQQMAAEGIKHIALVSEDISRYSDRSNLPALVTIHDRKDMDAVQRDMRELTGVTVIIYDQTCAAEKRRRRKKGEYPDPDQRLFINEAVCEGCGDCGVQSNCTSILPLETEFGRKRAIDQSSCNKDYSCVKGFCPSFVTVSGGKLKKSKTGVMKKDSADDFGLLPEPAIPSCDTPFNILINGIGGTGVITIGALMGMAAHLEGKGASVLDMTGMSQKNGSVTSHVRIARTPQAIRAQRIATGEADLILGCDMLTAGSHDAISKMRPGRTRAVVNVHQQPPGQFAKNPDWQFPFEDVKALIEESVDQQVDFIDATRLATALMGDSIATNLFMLGYAYQRGELPLTEAALLRAIEMNGVAIESNKTSFLWGRRAAVDLARVERIAVPAQPVVIRMPETLDKLIKRRVAFLTDYQDAAYAESFARFVEQVRAKEAALNLGDKLTMAVARNLSKLMAYKDEYEVARLYTDGRFVEQLKQQFEGDFSLSFNLAPPLFSKKDAQGRLVKAKYGSWMMSAFKVLAKFKGLRGGSFDIFGYTEERKTERRLIAEYRDTVTALLDGLNADKLALAVEIAQLPEQIRGYGHVKDKALAQARSKQDEMLTRYAAVVPAGLAQQVNVASIAAA